MRVKVGPFKRDQQPIQFKRLAAAPREMIHVHKSETELWVPLFLLIQNRREQYREEERAKPVIRLTNISKNVQYAFKCSP